MLAAIDMGSNSFRLHIGRFEGGSIQVVKSAREPNRLAAGLDGRGYLTEEAMKRGIDALKRLRAVLDQQPLSDVRAVATNTLRIANNAADFLQRAEQALGYPIEVISGEEEARLIYIGVANVLAAPEERRLVIDIGGGSTELILGRGQDIERAESFSVGTVRQSISFFRTGTIDRSAFDAAVLSARSHFEDVASHYHAHNWNAAYGSSGTIRATAEIIVRNKIGSGDLSHASLLALRDSMIGYGSIRRLAYQGLNPDRASSIVGGLPVLIALCEEMSIERMSPVEAGLRMGVMWDLYLQATKSDRREQSVRLFQQRFLADKERAARVADAALALYRRMDPDSGKYGRHLYWSALLHEIGMFVSPTNHHKHGAYLIENADLAGFTAREQRRMSRLVLGQKGNLRKLSDTLDDVDAVKAILALRLAVLYMHARAELDAKSVRLKVRNRIDIELDKKVLAQHPTLSYWLERERDWWEEVGVEFNFRGR